MINRYRIERQRNRETVEQKGLTVIKQKYRQTGKSERQVETEYKRQEDWHEQNEEVNCTKPSPQQEYLQGRLGIIDLLIEIGCFVKKKMIVSWWQAADLNKLTLLMKPFGNQSHTYTKKFALV